MKNKKSKIILSLILTCVMFTPLVTKAQAGVVINEVQASESSLVSTDPGPLEFIELRNDSDQSADISGWILKYVNSSGNSSVIFTFPSDTIMPPGGYYLGICDESPLDYLSDIVPKFVYAMSGDCLAKNNVGVTLSDTLSPNPIDSLYWTTASTSADIKVVPKMKDGLSVQRTVENGSVKYIVSTHSPESTELLPPPDPDPVPTPSPSIEPTPTPESEDPIEPTPTPTPLPTEDPVSNELPVYLNELFIDPASPMTDSEDEWVEIYNPNGEDVSLGGYTIYTGNSFSYRYTFDNEDVIPAYGFITVSSGESSLTLSNSGGAAKITGPSDQIFSQTNYVSAEPNTSWAKDENGVWVWTSTPTKTTKNVITGIPIVIKNAAASVQKSVKSTSKSKTTSTAAKKTTAKKASTKVLATTDTPDLVKAPTPLPSWLLALLGILAIIYAVYEYRFEISNKLYQLRQYRANRR
jgi:hypothetical protein